MSRIFSNTSLVSISKFVLATQLFTLAILLFSLVICTLSLADESVQITKRVS